MRSTMPSTVAARSLRTTHDRQRSAYPFFTFERSIAARANLLLTFPSCNVASVRPVDRREFVRRSGLVIAAGALPAWTWATAAPDKRLAELQRAIDGTVVGPASPAYAQARLSENTRFDAIHPHAVVYAERA